MRFNLKKLSVLIIILSIQQFAYAQATFETAQSGNWNNASTWQLISGSDANGKPDADDNVIVKSGHQVNITSNANCKNMEMNGGTITYNQNRTLKINQDLEVSLSSEFAGFSNNHVLNIEGDLQVQAGKTLTMGPIRLTVQENTTLHGHLKVSGFGQDRTFNHIDIQSNGKLSFSGQDTYTIKGNLNNDGTFEANSSNQIFDFTSSQGSISGSSELSFYGLRFDSPAAYTNTGLIVVRETMTGTGSFTNGQNARLELQNDGPFTLGTFDASGTGNEVSYTGFGNLQAFSATYYNLLVDKSSGTLSMVGNVTVNNALGAAGGILKVANANLSVQRDLLIFGGEFTTDDTQALVKIGRNIRLSDGIYDHNAGVVQVTSLLDATGGEFFIEGASSELSVFSAFFEVPMSLSGGVINASNDFVLYDGAILNSNQTELNIRDYFALSGTNATVTAGSITAGNVYSSPGDTLNVNGTDLTVQGFVLMDGAIRFNSSNGTKVLTHIFIRNGGFWEVTQPTDFTVRGNLRTNTVFKGDPGFGTSTYHLTGTATTAGGFRGTGTFEVRDLRIDHPAHYTNFVKLIVSQSINGSGTFANGESATLTYKGNNSNGSHFDIATFDASAKNNTVIYAGINHSQRWKPTQSANNDYYNVILQMGTGDYQRLELIEDIRVNGQLTITEGDVLLNQHNLNFSADATIHGTDSDDYIRINGAGKVRFDVNALHKNLFVPIGDGHGGYSPITDFKLTQGSLGNHARVDFSVVNQAHPNRDKGNINEGGNDEGIAAIDYLQRYWSIEGQGITDVQYDMVYKYLQQDVVGTESNLVGTLYRIVPQLGIKDWHRKGIVDPVNNTVTLTEADNFGDANAMDDDQSRLPIELLYFEARADEGQVALSWATISETNNQFFTIERSTNGFDFTAIATKSGAGNSSAQLKYQYQDEKPQPGRSYYRLKQTDFNGAFEYSELQSVFVSNAMSEAGMKLYPNPIARGNDLKIKLEGISQGSLQMRDASGMMVQQIAVSNQESVRLETARLKPGLYLIQIKSEESGERLTKRLLVQ